MPCLGTGGVPWAHLCSSQYPTKHHRGCAQGEKHTGVWDWSRDSSQGTRSGSVLWVPGIPAAHSWNPTPGGQVDMLPGDFSLQEKPEPELEMPMVPHRACALTGAFPCRNRPHQPSPAFLAVTWRECLLLSLNCHPAIVLWI